MVSNLLKATELRCKSLGPKSERRDWVCDIESHGLDKHKDRTITQNHPFNLIAANPNPATYTLQGRLTLSRSRPTVVQETKPSSQPRKQRKGDIPEGRGTRKSAMGPTQITRPAALDHRCPSESPRGLLC